MLGTGIQRGTNRPKPLSSCSLWLSSSRDRVVNLNMVIRIVGKTRAGNTVGGQGVAVLKRADGGLSDEAKTWKR